MDVRFRGWICNVISRRRRLLAIALHQRAKFEHWLKFEVAEEAAAQGATDIEIEPTPDTTPDHRVRSDLSFRFEGTYYHVELKTPNTNWRMPGVLDLTRPITKNIESIIEDARKPPIAHGHRIVAFTLFPVPSGDNRWHLYLARVAEATGLPLSEKTHASRVDIPLAPAAIAQVVVVTFFAPSSAVGSAPSAG